MGKETKGKVVMIRNMDEELWEKLRILSIKEKKTMAQLITELIKQGMKK